MAYNKTKWRDYRSPALEAKNLNKIEDELAVLDAEVEMLATSHGSGDVSDEVQNIRIGANGTTYPNAGTAVRAQYNQLRSAINVIRGSAASNLIYLYRTQDRYNQQNNTKHCGAKFERYIPEEYTIVESGIVFINAEGIVDELILENVGKRYQDETVSKGVLDNYTDSHASLEIAFTKQKGFSARGYLIYTYMETQFTVYTNVITGKYGDGLGGTSVLIDDVSAINDHIATINSDMNTVMEEIDVLDQVLASKATQDMVNLVKDNLQGEIDNKADTADVMILQSTVNKIPVISSRNIPGFIPDDPGHSVLVFTVNGQETVLHLAPTYIDKTLTCAKAPADAKAVGDAIAALRAEIDALKNRY